MSSHDIGNASKANTRFNLNDSVLKITTFCHGRDLLGHVNIACIDHARLTHETYLLTKWISKLPGSFEIHWVRQYLVNVVLFGTKDM